MAGSGEIQTEARGGGGRRSRSGDYIMQFLKERDKDLNITLVIAGLLSAVISAFVIAVQTQLQPDTGEESVAILRLLLYNANKTAFAGNVPTIPDWTGPPGETVAAQVLLYLSLAATLATVLFALLAKQLLDIYATVGSQGTDVERGRSLPRRLRIFALCLHLLLLMLPFLLQFALLLSGCALAVYLWNVNVVVSRIVLVIAIGVVPFYLLFSLLALFNLGFSHLWELLK